ncbi:MAG: hypothetical protein ACRCTZ_22895 [Sarcina sp.]
MRYTKKKGSTLIVVVCLCAFLSVLTLSIMLVTTGGFKLRKDENKRIENFYSADSGIEIAKSEIVKVIEEAIQKGNELVDMIVVRPMDFPQFDTSKENWEQEPFKMTFEDYISDNMEKRIDNTITPVETKIYEPFKRDNIEIKVDAKNNGTFEEDKIIVDVDGVVKALGDYLKPRYQKWELKSNFTDKNDKEREVVVNYKVKTPDYGKTSGEAVPNMNIFDYIMAIDGNLNIKSDGSFDALGDMWIGGTSQKEGRADLFDLYSPAVSLVGGTKGNASFNWQGDIVTGKDMLVDDTNLTVNNIYADDFIFRGEGEKIDIKGDLLLSNDLIFDAKNTKLNMQNLYALDEFDEMQDNQSIKDTTAPKDYWGKSSSIIVSSEDFGVGSNINIAKDAYVLGTAYLQLDKGKEYKTGESIAINKLSEPYTNRKFTESGYSEEEYLYKYLNPLHILDKKIENGEAVELDIGEKVGIVKKYFEDKVSNENKVLIGDVFKGLKVDNETYSSGILYDDGVLKDRNGSYGACECEDKHKDKVKCKINKFAQEAYNMGGKLSNSEAEMAFKNKKLDKSISVSNSFNWQFIKDNLMTEKTLKNKSGDVVFDRVESYPNSSTNPEVAIFRSRGTVQETIPNLKDNYFSARKINIIFNISSSLGSGGEPIKKGREIHFDKISSMKVKGNKVTLPLSYINPNTVPIEKPEEDDVIEFGNDLTLIISDGDINVIQGFDTHWEVRGMFYTNQNLNLVAETGMTFGNFGVPNFIDMNLVFKSLFGEVIGGVVDGGIIDQGNGENVTNAPDLLEQQDWNLIK